MEAFPSNFNIEGLTKKQEDEQIMLLNNTRKYIVEAVYEAVKKYELVFQFHISADLKVEHRKQLISELCDRFPNRIYAVLFNSLRQITDPSDPTISVQITYRITLQ